MLFANASRDLSALVRGEIALAKAELRLEAKDPPRVARCWRPACLGLVAFDPVVHRIALFLAWLGLEAWLAFLVVTVVLLLIRRPARPAPSPAGFPTFCSCRASFGWSSSSPSRWSPSHRSRCRRATSTTATPSPGNFATYADALSTYWPQLVRSLGLRRHRDPPRAGPRLPARVLHRAPGRAVEERPAGARHRPVLHQLPDPHAGLADDPVATAGWWRRSRCGPIRTSCSPGSRTAAHARSDQQRPAALLAVRGDLRPDLQLPAVHDAAALREPRAARPPAARGGRRPLRLARSTRSARSPGRSRCPGVVAGTLLTFIPAAGDYINSRLLGNTQTVMIGQVIDGQFLRVSTTRRRPRCLHPAADHRAVRGHVYVRRAGTEELVVT